MKKKPEYREEIIFHIDKEENNSTKIVVTSAKPGYRKVIINLPFTGDEARRKFFGVFFDANDSPSDPISTRKEKLVMRTIADIFNDFMTSAIHEPHKGKSTWEKERMMWISKLDPHRIYYVWNVLDKVFSDIE